MSKPQKSSPAAPSLVEIEAAMRVLRSRGHDVTIHDAAKMGELTRSGYWVDGAGPKSGADLVALAAGTPVRAS